MESDLPHPGDRPPSSPPGLEPGEGARRYEELADRLGVSFGQYQRVQCTLSWLPVPLAACALFSDSLYTLEPCHRCRETPTAGRGNTTSGHGGVTWGQRAEPCAIERCHNGTPQGEEGCPYGWEYEARGVLQHNIVTQWDLVCHRAWLVPIEEVIFILGCVFGSLVMGYLADRMGRRNTVMLSLMASILFGTLVAAAPNLPMFIFCRFLQGSAIAGLLLSLYVLRLELCDPPHRLVVAMVTGFLVVGGQFLLLGLALASREWRLLQAVITAPLGFFLVYCCPHVLLESPRWLVATSQTDEAKRVLAVMLEKGGRLPDREPLELEDTLAVTAARVTGRTEGIAGCPRSPASPSAGTSREIPERPGASWQPG